MGDELCPGAGKSSWPELVGKNGEEAVKIIEEENENVKAVVILKGSIVTQDINCQRVRVWVNDYGIVTSVPNIR
ncbi:hypothetical protein CsatB_025194 [Cannabis sativa]